MPSSASAASGVPICPSRWPKPAASAWPKPFTPTTSMSDASSVQLATITQTKPSHSRIVPGPRKPAPPGSTDFTRRHKRGMNQTADPPNQPKTTVCMLDINE